MWTLSAVVTILVLEIFVLPRLGGIHQSIHLLSHINIWVALTGTVLEAAALVAWAMLTYTVLPPGILLCRRIMQIDLSTLAVSHVMPGGTAFGGRLDVPPPHPRRSAALGRRFRHRDAGSWLGRGPERHLLGRSGDFTVLPCLQFALRRRGLAGPNAPRPSSKSTAEPRIRVLRQSRR